LGAFFKILSIAGGLALELAKNTGFRQPGLNLSSAVKGVQVNVLKGIK
jgi:hypothetical protein